jgi:hypothetical protein
LRGAGCTVATDREKIVECGVLGQSWGIFKQKKFFGDCDDNERNLFGGKKRQMLITDFIFGRGQRWAQNNKKVVWLAVLLLFSKFTFFVI